MKSSCQQGFAVSDAPGEGPSFPLLASGGPLACGTVTELRLGGSSIKKPNTERQVLGFALNKVPFIAVNIIVTNACASAHVGQ